MASFLQIIDLTKSYGERMLFDSITFGLNEGDKVGIVAKNGTGKSTLLRIIAGEEAADSGKVVWRNGIRVGYLPQKPALDDSLTVAEAAICSDDPVADVVREYEAARLSGDADAMQEAIHKMDAASAWDYEDRLHQLLGRLGIHNLDAKIGTLSGGQRKRVALASVIMRQPDIIILDEPTNHLDIDIIEWLENYLKRSRCTLLMVTHDRYFLDRICTRIIEIDNRRIYIYDGNYDYYLKRRAERIEVMTAELAKVRNTLRREQEWMSRQPQARAGKAKYRIDAFYNLKEQERNGIRPERDMDLNVKASYIGSKIFEAENISKNFGDKIILQDFSYTFARYEKVGLIGANGVGKSTFVKLLQGILPVDKGNWNVGDTVRFGYYSQEGISYDPQKKVIDVMEEEIRNGDSSMSAMQYLTKFLFPVADQQKYIHTLSGGELCRLHLAMVLMKQPNFLILDEPTNDLDIITLGILEEYLAEFKGCVIIVSHDRYFLDNIADHLFVMEGNGVVRDFPGTYSEYAEWRAARDAEIARTETVHAAPTERVRTTRVRKMTYKERKEFETLTDEIESLTAEKARLEARFNEGGNPDEIAALSVRYHEVSAILDEKEFRWLELSEIEA